MPVEVTYFDDDAGVLFLYKGTVTGKEVIEAIEKHFSSEERMQKYRYRLVDTSGVEGVEVLTREIEILVDMNRRAESIMRDGVVALVATTDVVLVMMKMWQAMMAHVNWETHIFRSRDDAVAWLAERVESKFGFRPTMG
jgi:hypothetical protein